MLTVDWSGEVMLPLDPNETNWCRMLITITMNASTQQKNKPTKATKHQKKQAPIQTPLFWKHICCFLLTSAKSSWSEGNYFWSQSPRSFDRPNQIDHPLPTLSPQCPQSWPPPGGSTCKELRVLSPALATGYFYQNMTFLKWKSSALKLGLYSKGKDCLWWGVSCLNSGGVQ